MKIIFFAIAMIMTNSMAVAETTYLQCKYGNEKKMQFSVGVDEKSGIVIFNKTQKINAFYNTNDIRFQIVEDSDLLSMVRSYIIDRNNLSCRYQVDMNIGSKAQSPIIYDGTCKIEIVSKERKI